MPTPDDRLFQRWGHSFEEDSEDVRVYRPADYTFPPARGRDGLEFRPDGSLVDWAIAPGDGSQPRAGSWHVDEDGHVHLTVADQAQRRVDVLRLTSDRLELRLGGTS